MNISLLTALVGAGGALVGSIVGGVITYFIQSKLLHQSALRDEASRLQDRRLDALQNIVIAVDVVLGNEGRTEGGEIATLMSNIIHELPKHIPFLPPDLRDEARSLMLQFFASARVGEMNVNLETMTTLKNNALQAIDLCYTNASSNGS